MNKIFKGIKVGGKVFNYYYQKWGEVVDCGPNAFIVSFILDTGEEVRYQYTHDGIRWFTKEIPPLPADDLSNLREGDKVFVQPYQEWGEVVEVIPADAGIVVKIPLYRAGDRYVMVTSTGLLDVNHKAPGVFLREVPQPS